MKQSDFGFVLLLSDDVLFDKRLIRFYKEKNGAFLDKWLTMFLAKRFYNWKKMDARLLFEDYNDHISGFQKLPYSDM